MSSVKARSLRSRRRAQPLDYLGLLGPLVFAQSYPGAASVFVDEFDAGVPNARRTARSLAAVIEISPSAISARE